MESAQEHEGHVALDKAQEWEIHGGQVLDKHGNLVDKYERKAIPTDFYKVYCIDDSQRGGSATRPWLGAIKDPSNPPAFQADQPSEELRLEHVYGYRALDTRQNVWYTSSEQEIVYMTASLGVVLNTETNVQRFFGAGEVDTTNGHNDDVTAIAIHPERNLIATGQVGKKPLICVWDTRNLSLKAAFNQTTDTKAVKGLSFSSDGKYLYSVGDNDKHTVFAYDWEAATMIASQDGGADFIVGIKSCPSDPNLFATAGKNGVRFWTLSGKAITGQKGIFGKAPLADMYSLEWTHDGRLISGSLKGVLYIWKGNQCVKTMQGHTGSISAISSRSKRLVTGGMDNLIHIYDADFKLKTTIDVKSSARAIDQDGEGDIVVGLRNGTILEIKNEKDIKVHMKGHSEGELWGLAVDNKTGYVVTTCDDNKILVWDPVKKACVNKGAVNAVAGPKTKGGASTLSSFPPNQCARAVDINQANGHVCIGINDGQISVRASVEAIDDVVVNLHHAKEWIEVIHYSPDGQKLAVGSHDNVIYIYSVPDYKLLKKLKKHNSFIVSFDWSEDSQHIQSNCGGNELLYYDIEHGTQITDADALKDEPWAKFSLKVGWPVQGIVPLGVDNTHVNGVSRSHNKKLFATGDDWRLVNIFRNPALAKAKPKSYIAHAEHVVRVAFSKDDSYLFTIGGADRTLMQWKIV